jgi:hypothetical protein
MLYSIYNFFHRIMISNLFLLVFRWFVNRIILYFQEFLYRGVYLCSFRYRFERDRIECGDFGRWNLMDVGLFIFWIILEEIRIIFVFMSTVITLIVLIKWLIFQRISFSTQNLGGCVIEFRILCQLIYFFCGLRCRLDRFLHVLNLFFFPFSQWLVYRRIIRDWIVVQAINKPNRWFVGLGDPNRDHFNLLQIPIYW